MGIVACADALKQAQELEVDLVEVAPNADPPVCKLLDYGKFKYRQKKKLQSQKHHRARVKEIRIGLTTDKHDLAFKAKRVEGFLAEHDRVVISMRLRGRQRAHANLAVEHMSEFAARFEEISKIESGPTRSSAGQITMLLTPR